MKTLKEFIFRLKFDDFFKLCALICFMLLMATPFWVGSKGLTPEAWGFLNLGVGALVGILSQRPNKLLQNNDTQKGNITQPIIPTPIGGTGVNNPCGNPNCGLPKA